MSAELIIGSIEPVPTWKIEIDYFVNILKIKWPNANVNIEQGNKLYFSTETLVTIVEFDLIIDVDEAWVNGLFDGTHLSLGDEELEAAVEVVIWYRTIVPEEYSLFAWWNDDIANAVEIQPNKTAQELAHELGTP